MKVFKLGTRASQLALWQAEKVATSLEKLGYKIEIIKISTTGDKLYNANLALIGGKGLFLKELEEAMIDGKIDFAVHSMKDVPAKLPENFVVHSIFEREDPRDVFISFDYRNLKDVPSKAKIGTSSTRRASLISKFRDDLECIPFRGNVVTRIDKVRNGEVAGCILALAGLKRLGLHNYVKHVFDIDEFMPAVTQGILAVEYLRSNQEIAEILKELKTDSTEFISQIERSFMKELDGNCTLPAALNAEIISDQLVLLRAMYFCTKKNKLYSIKESVDMNFAISKSKEIACRFKSV